MPAGQFKLDQQFLQVPSATLAGEELKTLTAAPHIAGSKEELCHRTICRTKISRCRSRNQNRSLSRHDELPEKSGSHRLRSEWQAAHVRPTPEHVSDDPYQDDKRHRDRLQRLFSFGDVTAEVVYANYGHAQRFR